MLLFFFYISTPMSSMSPEDSIATSLCSSEDGNDIVVPAASQERLQTPVAVVGMGCRLPGHSKSPTALWDLLQRGGIAENTPPESRFNLAGHYDGTGRARTMKSPGGMFMEYVDPAVFDGHFFSISRADCVAMDPQQRQLLEVAYEALENGGIPLEKISGTRTGVIVGNSFSDYTAIQNRDPEDRADSITIGLSPSILSNRLSHFFNISGPSISIDTACSGSLVSLDVACRFLDTHQADGMIVGGTNLWLAPEHNEEVGTMNKTQSASGQCRSFDASADGYVKAEAANIVYLKRLDDAVRDNDPIRAVIRGTASNASGRTAGLANPSSEAQAAVTRMAYKNAGIIDFRDTQYVECHGTGTLTGDPIEAQGVALVFAPGRPAGQELIIGSIKSNVGHSEAAAGISGLIKATMAVERGQIPGNPTFSKPNPRIDWERLKLRASRTMVQWPKGSIIRRASVNSFGFGGANAHAVLENATSSPHVSSYQNISNNFFDDEDVEDEGEEEEKIPPKLLVFSANEPSSLTNYVKNLSNHLLDPTVSIDIDHLAYTLSDRKSKLYYRAFTITQSKKPNLSTGDLVTGKQAPSTPRVGFVFTGQGAQWSQMGADLLKNFPVARRIIGELDGALKSLSEPPSWTLMEELTSARSAEALRQPEFSQPLVTALQLALLEVLHDWGVKAEAVVGHSSGEIAAAAAAGQLTYADAIKTAFYRGQAAKKVGAPLEPVGMLAVGIGANKIEQYLRPEEGKVQIACYNSPDSLTISGTRSALEKLRDRLQTDRHFARLLLVDLAYHSDYMAKIGEVYEEMLLKYDLFKHRSKVTGSQVRMFSSVTGNILEPSEKLDAAYWKSNMVSPVRFAEATSELIRSGEFGANFLIELGPSNALSGPIAQIKKGLAGKISDVPYTSCLTRGQGSVLALYKSAGQLYLAGGSVSLSRVNRIEKSNAKVIVDLPNYSWNHNNRYWHETRASKEWRFKKFVNHDLLGSKIPATAWVAPTFKKLLKLSDVPFLRDHVLGSEIVFPGAAYIAMAVEAIYQMTMAVKWNYQAPEKYRFRLKDVKILRALVLEENSEIRITLSLTPVKGGSTHTWYEFRVCSVPEDAPIDQEHCIGSVCIETDYQSITAPANDLRPLEFPTPARVWYKALADMGYKFGPCFQKHIAVESSIGRRSSRSTVSLEPPPSNPLGQCTYPMHPAILDSCLQATSPSLWNGEPPTSGSAVLVPKIIGSMVIKGGKNLPVDGEGIALASANWVGIGDKDHPRNYTTNIQVFSPVDSTCLFEMRGLEQGEIEVGNNEKAGHTFTRLLWNADVDTLFKIPKVVAQQHLATKDTGNLINLAVHKRPGLAVLELNLNTEDSSSMWNMDKGSMMRSACSQYILALRDPKVMLATQEQMQGTQVRLADVIKGGEIVLDTKFDLIIVKGPVSGVDSDILAQSIASSAKTDAFVVGHSLPETLFKHFGTTLTAGNGSSICQFQGSKSSETVRRTITHTSFVDPAAEQSQETAQVIKKLTSDRWAVKSTICPTTDIKSSEDIVLVVDELFHSLMDGFTEQQWELIKHLLEKRCRLLWVTVGSHLNVNDPNKAAIAGLLRTIRSEEQVRFITLDVENATGDATPVAISACLDQLSAEESDSAEDYEFVERGGVTYISRIVPDAKLTSLQSNDISEQPIDTVDFHECESLVRLRCERLGNLDSLHFGEVSPDVLPLPHGYMEVEIYAAGLNYKDVVVSMGHVPGDESQLGFEAAGVVKQVSSSVANYAPGDRVMVWNKGCFANRVRTVPARVHRIPDSLSFEDAATLPVVYVTSLHALFDMSNLSAGKTVLIHSAAGGVGIAAVQLAQYVGARVFTTVSSPEKRQFLQDTFDLSNDQIFNSRNTDFADQILTATNGRGVDVVLNSLTGDMLEESFRILADGGIMVEIGKKDILDRNKLTMTPFDRNISFRAVDLSAERAPDALIERSLAKLFKLLEGGHIKPINPVHRFSWTEIPRAVRFLRPGTHIGKVVLSDGPDAKVQVPIRRATPNLAFRDDGCYLIVGGLRGLCGSLAVYLAKQGAKNLAVISRSGHKDHKSQGIVKQINDLGAHIDLLTADVTNFAEVLHAFKQTKAPIAGIIQGAMVLRDRPFDQMTLAEYHEAVQCKTRGTWNLHNAAESLGLSLDFFTLLSSISGVIGNRGQANYAAANVFLDSFAAFRRARDQAVCSVNLGVIEDSGVIAETENLQNVFDTRVFKGINTGLLAKILYVSVLQQHAHPRSSPEANAQLITGLIVPQPADSQLKKDARFSALFEGHSASGGDAGGASGKDAEVQLALLLLKNESADEGARQKAVVDAINLAFVRMLHLPEAMDVERPLSVYGIDSLAAVELRNWIRTELGALVTTLDVLNASSLTNLSKRVISKIVAR
ncbi:hypothetical protein GGP41_009349 [Bipolaris sorokiniana]|uniref:Uncharacterized protein n=1 Tax=Cochliobolus sativus TaxID=45130 RepID=A0A8H5Z9Q4_COCSA|nr:hypothetical protein GGP41_009349 [Bipolaris sorokiniana]